MDRVHINPLDTLSKGISVPLNVTQLSAEDQDNAGVRFRAPSTSRCMARNVRSPGGGSPDTYPATSCTTRAIRELPLVNSSLP